jgi:hypothetical protein
MAGSKDLAQNHRKTQIWGYSTKKLQHLGLKGLKVYHTADLVASQIGLSTLKKRLF